MFPWGSSDASQRDEKRSAPSGCRIWRAGVCGGRDTRPSLLRTYTKHGGLRQAPDHAAQSSAMTTMTKHAVVIAGGGPTGLMLAGELALARVDVAIVERRESQDLAGSRSGGLHARTIEVLDQRGIADRFLSHGQVAQVAAFALISGVGCEHRSLAPFDTKEVNV